MPASSVCSENIAGCSLKMDEAKVDGVKEQLKGVADFAVGKLTGNKDRELRGKVEITTVQTKRIGPTGKTTSGRARMIPIIRPTSEAT
jgi:uncharacterized protein YjbJ (UPF0337 family)